MTASLTGVPAGSAPAALVLWSRWTLAGLRCNWAAGGLVGPWPCPQQKGQVQAGAERPHTLAESVPPLGGWRETVARLKKTLLLVLGPSLLLSGLCPVGRLTAAVFLLLW